MSSSWSKSRAYSSRNGLHADRIRRALQPPPELLQTRDNFPPLENAFDLPDGSSSVCSPSSPSSSSSLNLSIGTRAALGQHLRQVAIGDTSFGDRGDEDFQADQEVHSIDEPWECFLDGDLSSANTSCGDGRTSSLAGSQGSLSFSDTASQFQHAKSLLFGDSAEGIQGHQEQQHSLDFQSFVLSMRPSDRLFMETLSDSDVSHVSSKDDESSRISALDVSRISHDGSQVLRENSFQNSFVDCGASHRLSSVQLRAASWQRHQKLNDLGCTSQHQHLPTSHPSLVGLAVAGKENADEDTVNQRSATESGPFQPTTSKVDLSSSSPSSLGLAPGDRRRYRTVVPRRVFLNDPSQLSEYHDSFSAPTHQFKARNHGLYELP